MPSSRKRAYQLNKLIQADMDRFKIKLDQLTMAMAPLKPPSGQLSQPIQNSVEQPKMFLIKVNPEDPYRSSMRVWQPKKLQRTLRSWVRWVLRKLLVMTREK